MFFCFRPHTPHCYFYLYYEAIIHLHNIISIYLKKSNNSSSSSDYLAIIIKAITTLTSRTFLSMTFFANYPLNLIRRFFPQNTTENIPYRSGYPWRRGKIRYPSKSPNLREFRGNLMFGVRVEHHHVSQMASLLASAVVVSVGYGLRRLFE